MPSSATFKCREASAADLDEILRVQAACYGPALVEPPAVFLSMLEDPGAPCIVAVDTQDESGIVGYALAHLWDSIDAPPPLHEPAPRVPHDAARCLFVHDVAVAPEFRGRGVPCALLRLVRAQIPASLPLTGVAVQGTAEYWARHGMVPREVRAEPAALARLATYGPGAVYVSGSDGAQTGKST